MDAIQLEALRWAYACSAINAGLVMLAVYVVSVSVVLLITRRKAMK